jgi:hypothetical protein
MQPESQQQFRLHITSEQLDDLHKLRKICTRTKSDCRAIARRNLLRSLQRHWPSEDQVETTCFLFCFPVQDKII